MHYIISTNMFTVSLFSRPKEDQTTFVPLHFDSSANSTPSALVEVKFTAEVNAGTFDLF